MYVIMCVCSLVGYPPFSDERSDMELPKQITGGHYTHYMKMDDWDDISPDGQAAKHLICLNA